VVVDASIADLPMAPYQPSTVHHFRLGRCLGELVGGSSRVLGSICMESDILADRVEFPTPPSVGDLVVFSSAGGYNASMAWHFAGGVSRDS
jgi:diaminopimelate decarboxylase